MKFNFSLLTASALLALTLPMTGCGVLKTRSDVSHKKNAKTSTQTAQNSENSAPKTDEGTKSADQSAANSNENSPETAQNAGQDSLSKDLAAMQTEPSAQPAPTENSMTNTSGPADSAAMNTSHSMNSSNSMNAANPMNSANSTNNANQANPMNNPEYGAYPAAGARAVSNVPMAQSAFPVADSATNGSFATGTSNLQSLRGLTFEANYGNTKSQIFFESDKSIVISKEIGRNQRTQERIAADISGVRPGVFMISGRGADQIAFTMIGDVEQGLVRTTTVSPDQSQMTKTGSFKKIR